MKIRLGACLLIASLPLSACSGAAEPTVLPPIVSASPAVPTPTLVVIPTEAMAETSEGASAFARYYLDAMNRGFATGDASELQLLSSPECAGCENLINLIEEGSPGQEVVEGGDYAVNSVASPEIVDGEVTALLSYDLTAVRVTDNAGQVVRELPRKQNLSATLSMSRSGSGWSVLEFESVP